MKINHLNSILSRISTNSRDLNLIKNISASIFIKGGSIIITLMLVPLSLEFLGKEKYGIWITIFSVFAWMSFFDFGLGSGLRNHLAKALAVNDYKTGKELVSSAFFIITMIVISLIVIYLSIKIYLPWAKILHLELDQESYIYSIIDVVIILFLIRFSLKLIGVIFIADQKPAINNLAIPLSNLIVLILIFFILKIEFHIGSIKVIAYLNSMIPIFVYLVMGYIAFKGIYKLLIPNIKYVSKKRIKEIWSLGVGFFIIQICLLIIFQSANFIISYHLGPEYVTEYSVAFKYANILNMGYTIIINPYWSAFTAAWINKEFSWIKKSISKLFLLWLGIVLAAVIMYIFSDNIFKFWLNDKITIDKQIVLMLLISVVLTTLGNIFNMFVNGIGKIKIQIVCFIIGAVFFYPLSMYFINKLENGIVGVIFAMIIANFYSYLIAPIQTYHYLYRNK